MVETDPRAARLRATFDAELAERAGRLAETLGRLERDEGGAPARPGLLAALLHDARGLKGAARAVEAAPLERLAHALEAALVAARDAGDRPPAAWFDAARRAVALVAPLGAAGAPEQADYAPTLAALDAAARRPAAPAAPPPAPMPPAAPAADGPARAGESVRVAVDKLDALLAQSGELAVTQLQIQQRLGALAELRETLGQGQRDWRAARGLRAGLRRAGAADGPAARDLDALLAFTERAEQRAQETLRRVDDLVAQLRQDTAQLGLVAQRIGEEVLAARLVPVATLFGPFERLVRDQAREAGKEVRLALDGGETEIDRKILELLRDPLMHMLRNAVDHGIESPGERQARGKARAGTVRLAAAQRGNTVEIVLEDDGAGLDPDRLRATAVRRGLLSEAQAQALDDQAALDLIFHSGFTTRTAVTATSGRGVGMDVVREHVQRLNGDVAIEGAPGRGARFVIGVPLTLATTRAILVEQGDRCFAVPAALVERTARAREADLVSLGGQRAVAVEGRPVPVVALADVLELPRGEAEPDGRAWRPFFVLRQEDRRVAFLVDRLAGEQELVVKRLGWPLRRVRNVAGAAVLGSGQAVTILNPADLLKSSQRPGGARPAPAPRATDAAAPRRQRRVLVVDDSLPTRTLVRSILETAGYATAVAADGEEALRLLRAEPMDLVVTDVEMPRLDGFGLTAEIRRDERLRLTPVVLVTSLGAPADRERGVAAGADAYIVKSGFDQGQLLDTIGRLL